MDAGWARLALLNARVESYPAWPRFWQVGESRGTGLPAPWPHTQPSAGPVLRRVSARGSKTGASPLEAWLRGLLVTALTWLGHRGWLWLPGNPLPQHIPGPKYSKGGGPSDLTLGPPSESPDTQCPAGRAIAEGVFKPSTGGILHPGPALESPRGLSLSPSGRVGMAEVGLFGSGGGKGCVPQRFPCKVLFLGALLVP